MWRLVFEVFAAPCVPKRGQARTHILVQVSHANSLPASDSTPYRDYDDHCRPAHVVPHHQAEAIQVGRQLPPQSKPHCSRHNAQGHLVDEPTAGVHPGVQRKTCIYELESGGRTDAARDGQATQEIYLAVDTSWSKVSTRPSTLSAKPRPDPYCDVKTFASLAGTVSLNDGRRLHHTAHTCNSPCHVGAQTAQLRVLSTLSYVRRLTARRTDLVKPTKQM